LPGKPDVQAMTAGGSAGRRKARVTRFVRGLSGVAVFLLLAEILSRTGLISRAVVPPVSDVLARAAGLAGDTRFLSDLAATVQAWALGLAITIVLAVPCGVVLGTLPGVRIATRAIVEFLRPIPSVAVIPLVGLILGAGLRMTLTLIVYAAIWPVLFNTIYGLDDVDPVAIQTLRAFGFGRLAVIQRVSLPSAAPFIATGIRLASAIAIILDVGTGILTGRINGSGLGAFIADANSGAGDTTLVLAATVWAGILGLALNALIVWGERRVFHWHHAYAMEAG
jgi:NitT/TauT family transport system permease protein